MLAKFIAKSNNSDAGLSRFSVKLHASTTMPVVVCVTYPSVETSADTCVVLVGVFGTRRGAGHNKLGCGFQDRLLGECYGKDCSKWTSFMHLKDFADSEP